LSHASIKAVGRGSGQFQTGRPRSFDAFFAAAGRAGVVAIFGGIVAVLDGVAPVVLGIPGPGLWALPAFVTTYVPNVGSSSA